MTKRARAVRLGLLVLCVAVAVAGCRRPGAAVGQGGGAAGTGAGAGAAAGVGGARVAVMAPGAAEMLASLGLLERVVAVGDFVDWPPAMRSLPRLGAYDAPNEERVLALGVRVLITSLGREGTARMRHLESLGVTVVRLDLSTFDGAFTGLAELGARFGRREQAAALARAMREQLAAVERAAARAPRRRVLFVVGREPLYVAGKGSHLDRLIQLAGGSNVAFDSHAPYELTSFEVVLARRPEVIIDTSENRPLGPVGRLLGSWQQWPFLPAVRDGRVYRVDPWRLNVPGPRLPAMAQLMGRLIHPEIFGEAAAADVGPPSAASGSGPPSAASGSGPPSAVATGAASGTGGR